jgi:hypothetical protein
MKYLLGLLILLNIADAVLTNVVVGLGLGNEGNPFLLGLVGGPGFIIIKVIGALICAFILWDIHRRHPRLAFVSTSVFVAFYTGVVTWNSAVFLL